MSPANRVAGQRLSPIRRMAVGAPPDAVNLALGEPGWPLPDVARDALAAAGAETGPLPYGPNTSRPDLVHAIAARHAHHAHAAQTDRTRHKAQQDTAQGPTEHATRPDRTRHTAPQDTAQGPTEHGTGPDRTRPPARTGGLEVSADQVMVTSGSQAALFALFQAHVDPGSTVLVPDPGFVSYPSLARLCGAEPVGYPLAPRGDLDAEALVTTLEAQPQTSMVVLCHPANPTGGMASAAALTAVAEACADRGVLLVSDEVYRELWVDEPPPSLHDVAGAEAGVVLGSLSKAFGAPGLRLGWAVGAAETLAPARIVHNAMTTAPAQPSQTAALALLAAADEVLAESRRQVRRRWETAERVSPTLTGLDHAAPSNRAGIYLWVPVPNGAADAAHPADPAHPAHPADPADPAGNDPTLAFALRLRDEGGVTTVPGSAFGPRGAGHLRVSLGGPLDELEEGLRRLAPWWTT